MLLKLRNCDKNLLNWIIFYALFVLLVVSSGLYMFVNSIIFPVINLVILFSFLFLFNGKKRIYAIFLFIPFVTFFNFKQLGIGSFFSYFVILYCVVICIETIVRKEFTFRKFIPFFIILFLFAYTFILTIITSGFNSLVQTISIFGYFFAASLLFVDSKAEKNPSILLFLIVLGLIISNAMGCAMVYLVKGDFAISFLERFVNPVYARQYKQGNFSFRFPGLYGDPNYLGLFIGFITAIYLVNFNRIKHKFLLIPLVAILQVFPLLGESKNYFIVIIAALIIAFVLLVLKRKHGIFIGAGVLCLAFIIFIIFANTLFLPVILRILNIDTRDGFLNALTTNRITLQLSYLYRFSYDYKTFIFGNGFGAGFINGGSAHNTYVMMFWYFGIIGTILYISFLFKFINFKVLKQSKFLILPLLVPLFYGLSLDYVSYSEMLLFIFFLYFLFAEKFMTYKTDKEIYAVNI